MASESIFDTERKKLKKANERDKKKSLDATKRDYSPKTGKRQPMLGEKNKKNKASYKAAGM